MLQNKVISSVIRDLKAARFILPEDSGYVKEFLNQVWVEGWEEGRKNLLAHNKKRIGQYNLQWKLLHSYASATEAAKNTGHKVTGIYSAIKRGSRTKQGWYWKYV